MSAYRGVHLPKPTSTLRYQQNYIYSVQCTSRLTTAHEKQQYRHFIHQAQCQPSSPSRILGKMELPLTWTITWTPIWLLFKSIGEYHLKELQHGWYERGPHGLKSWYVVQFEENDPSGLHCQGVLFWSSMEDYHKCYALGIPEVHGDLVNYTNGMPHLNKGAMLLDSAGNGKWVVEDGW